MFSDLSLRLQRGLPEFDFQGPVRPPAAQAESVLASLGNNRPPEPATEGGIRGFFRQAQQPGGFFDRLNVFGAQLQDIDDGGNRAATIQQSRLQAQQRQQQAAARQQLNQLLIGRSQAANGGGQGSGPPDLRTALPALLAAQGAGVDIGDYVNLLDKAGPDIQVANGVAYDRRATTPGSRVGVNLTNINGTLADTQDPRNANRFIPEVGEGQELVYDANGRPMIRPIQGYADASAIQEAAVTGARSAAQAPYQFQTVTGPNGEPITAAASQLAGGIIRGQTPADRIRQEGAAERDVNRATNSTQARGRLQAANVAANNLAQTVDRAIGQLERPGATGALGVLTAGIPGSSSRDLRATIETIKANVGFDYLQQMRELSPTGGALGQVAVQELQALQSVLGNLDPTQSPEQLRQNLQAIKSQVNQGLRLRREAFEQQYGSQGQSQSQRPDRAALEAEARRRGLIR